MREGDTVARLGADEFVRARADGSSTRRTRPAWRARWLEVLRAPFRVAERELFVTGSLGISLFPSDGTAPEPLLNNAHTAIAPGQWPRAAIPTGSTRRP